MAREIELKFGVPPAQRASLRAALQARGARSVLLVARYFDTPDGRLAAQGIAWRLRREGRVWHQAVKSDDASVGNRFEDEVRASSRSVPDLALHGEPARQRVAEALAGFALTDLVECCATQVRRLRCRVLLPGGTRVEVAYDEGQVQAAGRSDSLAELEVELIEGSAQAMVDLVRPWMPNGLWLSTLSKAERGQRLRDDSGPNDRPKREPALRRRAPAAGLMRGVLQSCLLEVLQHAGDVAEGRASVESVHRLRVGLRRLMTALQELRRLAPRPCDLALPALQAVFRRLGVRRDADAVPVAVQPVLAQCGVALPPWPAAPQADPAGIVRDPAFQLALLDLVALGLDDDSAYTDWGSARTRRHVRGRLERLDHRVRRGAARFADLSSEERHRLRRQLKRLRHLLDLTRPLWPRRSTQRYLRALAVAQEALGHYVDAVTAEEVWSGRADDDAVARAAVDCLRKHLDPAARRAAKSLLAITDKPPFGG